MPVADTTHRTIKALQDDLRPIVLSLEALGPRLAALEARVEGLRGPELTALNAQLSALKAALEGVLVEPPEEEPAPPEDPEDEEPEPAEPQPAGVLFEERFRGALDIWDLEDNPRGRWKPNYWFGSDGDNTHPGSGYADGLWPDSASSRAGAHDLQTYSNAGYNGIDPFSTGPNGLVIRAGVNPRRTEKTPAGYFGGLITTQKSFGFTYGYVETRAKVSRVKGAWPAVWLLGRPYSDNAGDEVDILEHIGGEAAKMHGFVHLPRLGRDLLTHEMTFDPDQWVTRGFLWTPDRLALFHNGQEVASAPNPANGLHEPMYLLADLAVGPKDGGWGAVNQPGAGFAAEFAIDYIRVSPL